MKVKRACELVAGDVVQLRSGGTLEVQHVQPWRGNDWPIGASERPLVLSFVGGRATITRPDAFIQLAEAAA